MASQQPQARPWLRLASLSRPSGPPIPAPAPAPAPAPQAQPSAPQPRAPFIRPAFQTFGIPTTQPPPPAPQEPTLPSLPPPDTATTSSVPTSPIIKAVTPSPKPSPTPTTLPITSASPSVPPSPKRTISETTISSAAKPMSPSPEPAPAVVSSPPITRTSFVPASPVIETTSPSHKASPISTNSPNVVQTSPKPTIRAPSSFSPSPPPKPWSFSPTPAPAATTITARLPTPTSSPGINVNPPPPASPSPKIPSPQIKPLTPPPSPLMLPPAQLKSDFEREPMIPPEAEQKTVLVQESIERHKVVSRTFNGDPQRHAGQNQIPTAGNGRSKDIGYHKKLSDSEEFGMRLITIAGENKGAIMEMGPSPKKHDFRGNPHSLHTAGNARAWGEGEKSGSSGRSSSEEGMSKSKDKSQKATMVANSSLPLNAYMNSNVQGVNNSILYNCSCTHHDPGVHLSLSRNGGGRGGGMHAMDHKDGKHS